MPPRLPNVSQLPNLIHTNPAKDHILTYHNFYPSGPKTRHVRLKYPYMSAQTLADHIAHSAGKGEEKTSKITGELFQAMGNVGTGMLARPITGMTIKVSGCTHVEKTFGTTVKWHRGSLAKGNTEKKLTTVQGRMGTRTTQVTICSAAFPF